MVVLTDAAPTRVPCPRGPISVVARRRKDVWKTKQPQEHDTALSQFEGKDPSLRTLLSFGFLVPPYLRAEYPRRIPPAVGFFTSVGFEPERWKPNYPNPAFRNMRPDDAFFAARLVSGFSDAAIRTIVEQVDYDDPEAVEYLTRTLLERRDRIVRTWLTGVNPLRNFALP